MKPSGTADEWDRKVYNSKDGKTYTGSFILTGPNTAQLKGCVVVFRESQTSTRAK